MKQQKGRKSCSPTFQSIVTNRFMVGLKSFLHYYSRKEHFYFLFTKYISLVKKKTKTKFNQVNLKIPLALFKSPDKGASYPTNRRVVQELYKMESFYRQKEGQTERLKEWIISGKVMCLQGMTGGLLQQTSSLVLTRNFQSAWFKILLLSKKKIK